MPVIRERSEKQDLLTENFLRDTSVGVCSTSGPLYASAHAVAVSGGSSHCELQGVFLHCSRQSLYFYLVCK